jgi:predicted Zn-dependent protease
MGRAVFHTNGPVGLRVRGFEVAAWGAIQLGDSVEARALLDELPEGAEPDPIVVAAIHEMSAAPNRSVDVLQRARDAGDRRPELAGHLIRVLLAARRAEEACAVTRETLDAVDSDEARRVAREALGAGAPHGAGELYADVFARDGVIGDAVEAARAFLRATEPDRARGVLQAALRSGVERAAIVHHDAELASLI